MLLQSGKMRPVTLCRTPIQVSSRVAAMTFVFGSRSPLWLSPAANDGLVSSPAVCGHPRGAHLIAPRLCRGMSLERMMPSVAGCLANGSSWPLDLYSSHQPDPGPIISDFVIYFWARDQQHPGNGVPISTRRTPTSLTLVWHPGQALREEGQHAFATVH